MVYTVCSYGSCLENTKYYIKDIQGSIYAYCRKHKDRCKEINPNWQTALKLIE